MMGVANGNMFAVGLAVLVGQMLARGMVRTFVVSKSRKLENKAGALLFYFFLLELIKCP